jgi:hypothetical protein
VLLLLMIRSSNKKEYTLTPVTYNNTEQQEEQQQEREQEREQQQVAGTNPTTNLRDGIDKKWLERIQPPICVTVLTRSGRNKSSHRIEILRFKKHAITTSEVKKVAGFHPVTLLCNYSKPRSGSRKPWALQLLVYVTKTAATNHVSD